LYSSYGVNRRNITQYESYEYNNLPTTKLTSRLTSCFKIISMYPATFITMRSLSRRMTVKKKNRKRYLCARTALATAVAGWVWLLKKRFVKAVVVTHANTHGRRRESYTRREREVMRSRDSAEGPRERN